MNFTRAKKKTNKRKAVANSLSQDKVAKKQRTRIVDSRSECKIQQQLRSMESSPSIKNQTQNKIVQYFTPISQLKEGDEHKVAFKHVITTIANKCEKKAKKFGNIRHDLFQMQQKYLANG